MSSQIPRVSVVMPAYNAARFIGESVNSVICQSVTDWELVVVDDCSTDDTREIVKALCDKDSRIRLIELERNFGGPAGPRNVGIKEAKAKLIAFLDSDDIWHPEKLAHQLAVMDKEKAVFVCSEMVDFSNEADILFPVLSNVQTEAVSFMQQSVRARIPTSSVLVFRSILQKVPFREDPAYKAVEDYHCWLRILDLAGECVKIKAPLLWYRRSEGQISGSKLTMMKRVLMVHREFPGRSRLSAYLFTLSHVLGGFYFRFLKKGM